MKTQQVSNELTEQLIQLTQIAHDESLTDLEKNQKLDSVKKSTLQKINEETNLVSFKARSIFENIKQIIQTEDWAKLPTSHQLSGELQTVRSMVSELNSIRDKVVPDLQALQTAFIESMLDLLKHLSDSDVLALDQQWKAADIQFQKSEDAAKQEHLSGVLNGSIGIATSLASIAAKTVVTKLSKDKFDKAKPTERESENLVEAKKLQQKTQIDFKKVQSESLNMKKGLIENESRIQELGTKLEDKDISKFRRGIANLELKTRQEFANTIKTQKLPQIESRFNESKRDFEMATNNLGAINSSIDMKTAQANRYIQELRAVNDVVDYSVGLAKSIGEIGTKTIDFAAKKFQIESEKANFMNNAASSVQQNARKSVNQAQDTINSMNSNLAAMIQGSDSTTSFIIRTI